MPTTDPLHRFYVDQVAVEVYADKSGTSQAAALFVAATIRRALSERGEAAMILATGASQYDFLTAVLEERLDWSRVTAFHLDEYLDLSPEHPASFRRYLRERFFDHVELAAVHLLDGNAVDPQVEAARYAALLAAQPIDIACVGIGENGHLAFNDPPADFDTAALVHVVDLDDACRRQQVGEGHFPDMATVPPQALSLTVPAILAAQTISCVVPGERKANAVLSTLEGPITESCPASALRRHGNCHVYLDRNSAVLLEASKTG